MARTASLPRYSLAVVTAAASVMALTLFVQPAQAAGRPLTTAMTGAAEVPGPGDPDGSGTASLTVNGGTGQICYSLEVSGIAPAIAAHIHVGAASVAGPVVVPLAPPVEGTSEACASVDKALALAIIRDPANYYVNVHNVEYPAGALRGQLG